MLAAADLPAPHPLERWDAEALDAPADILAGNALRFAALLRAGPARFDAAAFRLGRADAAALDPQQRVLLEQVARALQVRGPTYIGSACPVRGARSKNQHLQTQQYR
jgi:acyl transferase domain-containing protein